LVGLPKQHNTYWIAPHYRVKQQIYSIFVPDEISLNRWENYFSIFYLIDELENRQSFWLLAMALARDLLGPSTVMCRKQRSACRDGRSGASDFARPTRRPSRVCVPIRLETRRPAWRRCACAMRDFAIGHAEIRQAWKSVPVRNAFRATMQPGCRGEKFSELPLGPQLDLRAAVLGDHTELGPAHIHL